MLDRIAPLFLSLALPHALAQEAAVRSDLARLEMHPVELRLGSGKTVTVERGNLTVPIVRADPASKPITIDVWRFSAVEGGAKDTPPIFRLYGGPGWPGFEPEQVDYENEFLPLLSIADVVVVGQRGIGTSKPDTVCAGIPADPEGVERTREQHAAALIAACAACRAHWEAQGYDLRGLNVLEAAADVDDVRRLLGYEKITLWGGSFGSHWSMAVLRRFPGSVARAVLTGLEGPDHTYDMPGGVLAALERMAAEAERSPKLAEHVPEGGLIAAFRALVADVEEHPIELEVRHPRTGRTELVRLDAGDLRGQALGTTGRTSSRGGARTWAADLLALFSGDFERAAEAKLAQEDGELPTASFFMLDCGSGISPARLERLRADPAMQVVGDLGWYYQTACSAWPADLGEDFRAGFTTEVPTVLVQGTWDTNTPLENALELLPSFVDGHLVLVEGGSHGALEEALDHSREFGDALMRFVATGDRSGLPGEVVLAPLEWAGPHPPR